ncbi:hypothetical protein K7W42_19385 [Deinococcus sp. HMF7604]|uniref:hypothetical protein n=1 Tax=Deinococcus betulae TaxID=2873312 RepID=UPI001CCE639C|nr:hypothetical protein [Deinococcus betulae]MBZ9753005.1 hypothetical protein [Deinococcus betulae]
MTPPTVLEALRSQLEAAFTAAGVALGLATVNGVPVAALNIGDWPEGTTVTGLEVLVSRTPQQREVDAFAFLGFVPSYTIRLINWSGAEDLEAATNAIAEVFWPLAEEPRLIPESPQNPEQVTLAVTPD